MLGGLERIPIRLNPECALASFGGRIFCGKPPKSAVADLGYIECRSRVNPRSVSTFPENALSGPFGGRIDHGADLGDLAGGKSADLRVLADDGFILGEIDAKGLVSGDEALDPLDVGTELMQRLVGFRRRPAQLLALQAADLGNIPLDDEPAQCHVALP